MKIYNTMSNVEEQVMGRVAVIYAVRKLRSATAVKVYALALSCIGVFSLVSVPHVLSNLVHVGLPGLSVFLLVALTKTQLMVQVAVLIGGSALVSLLPEFFSTRRSALRTV